ncbi:hypothetical protein SERMPA_00107 (plasmid) [Serratia marcescens]
MRYVMSVYRKYIRSLVENIIILLIVSTSAVGSSWVFVYWVFS